MHGKIEPALAAYLDAESELDALDIVAESPAYAEQQRVLSHCLMRQGNILRQMGEPEKALALGERELGAASASDDVVTLGRSLMSNGTNHVIAGTVEKGLALMEQARELFQSETSYDHLQGLGWYWILQADLANAGILDTEPVQVIEMVSRALEILEPIENWPGVARAYAALAQAHERVGECQQAERDRQLQAYYASRFEG